MRILLTIILAAGLQSAWAQENDERLALVIGNSKHPIVPLVSPVNDAIAMKTALEGIGFRVTLLTDANEEQMYRAIREFVLRIAKDSVALVFYAGHGVRAQGSDYLIPIDCTPRDTAELKFHAIEVADITKRLEESPASVRVIILDATFPDPFGTSASLTDEMEGGYIVYSGAPGRPVVDGKETSARKGVFTSALVDELSSRRPGTTFDDLIRHVRQRVFRETDGKQVPFVGTSLIKEWYPFGVETK